MNLFAYKDDDIAHIAGILRAEKNRVEESIPSYPFRSGQRQSAIEEVAILESFLADLVGELKIRARERYAREEEQQRLSAQSLRWKIAGIYNAKPLIIEDGEGGH